MKGGKREKAIAITKKKEKYHCQEGGARIK